MSQATAESFAAMIEAGMSGIGMWMLGWFGIWKDLRTWGSNLIQNAR